MKILLTILGISSSLTLAHAQSYSAALTSLNEVPPSSLSTVEGTYGFGNFSLSGTTLTVTGGFYGYSYTPTVISLNDGPSTANGPILLNLNIDNDAFPVGGGFYDGTFSGSGTLTAGEITDLNDGDLYVNIQTAVSQASEQPGEMRGQLGVVPEPSTVALVGTGLLSLLSIRRRKV
jgi:hypothetical protein